MDAVDAVDGGSGWHGCGRRREDWSLGTVWRRVLPILFCMFVIFVYGCFVAYGVVGVADHGLGHDDKWCQKWDFL